jgi:hypothetical protein
MSVDFSFLSIVKHENQLETQEIACSKNHKKTEGEAINYWKMSRISISLDVDSTFKKENVRTTKRTKIILFCLLKLLLFVNFSFVDVKDRVQKSKQNNVFSVFYLNMTQMIVWLAKFLMMMMCEKIKLVQMNWNVYGNLRTSSW